MHLHVVANAPEPIGPYVAPPPRRPGERREPLVDLVVPAAFAAGARELQLAVPVAAELALERAIAVADLRRAGAARDWEEIVAIARRSQVSAVAAPYATYLRSLTFGRLRGSPVADDDAVIDVPLRLFPRVAAIDYAQALTVANLEEALLLEVAAVSSGRIMTEWVLGTALTVRR
jgi:hypothetical protein